jgi:HAD superfamily hydrolase (TIGR01509 family)
VFFSKKNSNLNAVIFDMDGVLIDSEPIYIEIDKIMFKKYGLDSSKIDLEDYIGINLYEMWEDLINKNQLEINDLDKIVEDHVTNFYLALKNNKELQLMPGILDWIKYFKENNIKMMLASSSYPLIVQHIYSRFNLDNYMCGYIDINEIKNGKPAPDIFLQAAKMMKVNTDNGLIIEDSENGVNAAYNAGIKSIAFQQRADARQNLAKADMIIEEFNSKNLHTIIN